MTRELQPCGTRAAYSRHRRNGEDACDPCLAANRECGKEARAARERAFQRLAKAYPDDYRALFNEELARGGGPR